MRPEHGVRYELRLSSSSEPSVEYHVRVEEPERELEGSARIDVASGKLELAFEDPAALSRESEQTLRALLRALYRGQQSNGQWPRRITRWRGEPEP